MTARVCIYDGAVKNPESNLLRTIFIIDIKNITSDNDEITINRENGEQITFDAPTAKIIIE